MVGVEEEERQKVLVGEDAPDARRRLAPQVGAAQVVEARRVVVRRPRVDRLAACLQRRHVRRPARSLEQELGHRRAEARRRRRPVLDLQHAPADHRRRRRRHERQHDVAEARHRPRQLRPAREHHRVPVRLRRARLRAERAARAPLRYRPASLWHWCRTSPMPRALHTVSLSPGRSSRKRVLGGTPEADAAASSCDCHLRWRRRRSAKLRVVAGAEADAAEGRAVASASARDLMACQRCEHRRDERTRAVARLHAGTRHARQAAAVCERQARPRC